MTNEDDRIYARRKDESAGNAVERDPLFANQTTEIADRQTVKDLYPDD